MTAGCSCWLAGSSAVPQCHQYCQLLHIPFRLSRGFYDAQLACACTLATYFFEFGFERLLVDTLRHEMHLNQIGPRQLRQIIKIAEVYVVAV